jgi:diacylglycerol kinase (ATP)
LTSDEAYNRPALLVANAHSRRGQDVAPFAAALEQAGINLIQAPCRRREELSPLIRSMRDRVGRVILGGGDGTLNAAAAGLRDTGLPLGILPLGTANDLARTLKIPNNPEQAAAVIVGGRTTRLDLGCVNGHLFFNVASLGLSVDITRRLTKVMKRRWGRLAYPIAAAAVVLTAQRFSATMRHDGQDTALKSMQIAVGNGRFYGGGMVVAEEARINDGFLDVYSLEPHARWRLLLMARAFRDGEHGRLDEVRTLRCRSLEVRTRRTRHVSADGEIVTTTPARFTTLPGAVTVFAPAPGA